MNPRERFSFGIIQLAPPLILRLTSNALLFHRKTNGILLSSSLVVRFTLWQSYLDTYGDRLMLKPINMIRNAVKPLGAIILALLMTLSSPVVARDFTVAQLKPLAEDGSQLAQFELGNMYENGRGVLQDYAEAVRWYRLAADQGNAMAQSNLGYMYGLGYGVLQDNVMAHLWYNIGAANGNEISRTNRDSIAEGMNQQAMARECMSSGYQNCGY